MPYDFPNNPTENLEYTPIGGMTYVYLSPRWRLKGTDAAGGSQLPDAPLDGKQYGRQSAAWTPIVSVTWSTITGKPATFPPTVPIAWTDVSGKPATFPPTVPINWTNITGQPASYPPTLPIAWADISNKPTTYPPTVPIAWTDISGKPSAYQPIAHLHPISEVSGLQAALDSKAAVSHSHTTSQITGLDTALDGKEPTITAGSVLQYWRGDKTWQPLPPAGIQDAPSDGKSYVRKNGTWVEAIVDPPAMTYDVNGDAVIKFSGNIMVRVKPTGLVLTKDDVEVFSVSV
jgi:hypothetical protein